MKHRQQPKESKLCGHTVVAMATDESIKTIVKIIGHERATDIGELIHALEVFRIKTKGKRLVRWNKKLNVDWPEFAILMKTYNDETGKRYGHWVLVWNSILHDPAYEKAEMTNSAYRITSYIELIPEKRTK
jgi:hypothetical protein